MKTPDERLSLYDQNRIPRQSNTYEKELRDMAIAFRQQRDALAAALREIEKAIRPLHSDPHHYIAEIASAALAKVSA